MSVTRVPGPPIALSADEIVVSVQAAVPIDLSALLLTEWGRVRRDSDLIFYNQPRGPGIRLIPDVGVLVITPGEIPAGISRIRVVLALDDQRGHFDDSPPPRIDIRDREGDVVHTFTLEGLGAESTAVAMDLERCEPPVRGSEYRNQSKRDDRWWSVRTVSRGVAAGFVELMADHGVAVDHSPSALGGAGSGLTLSQPGSAELVPGQHVALSRDSGELTYVKMALGWDPVRERGRWGGMRDAGVDLDASALLYAGCDLTDAVYFDQRYSRDGSVRHQGDNITGAGKGEDEVLTIDLTRLPPHVTTLMFIVTSYQGQTFERVQNAFCRIIDGTTGAELARYDLLGGGAHTGMVMAKLYRRNRQWKLQAIGEAIQAGHPVEAVPQLAPFL